VRWSGHAGDGARHGGGDVAQRWMEELRVAEWGRVWGMERAGGVGRSERTARYGLGSGVERTIPNISDTLYFRTEGPASLRVLVRTRRLVAGSH
jgi:hypothetical protein